MHHHAVLARFGGLMRCGAPADGPGARVERDGPVVRRIVPDGQGLQGVRRPGGLGGPVDDEGVDGVGSAVRPWPLARLERAPETFRPVVAMAGDRSVSAADHSSPLLQRLGFPRLSTTAPYVFDPGRRGWPA